MEAAKNRKAVAEASDRLVSCFEAMAKRESGTDMKDDIKNIKDHICSRWMIGLELQIIS